MTDLDALVGAVGVRRRRDRRHLTWIGESIVGLDDPRAVETLADVLYGNAYVLGAPTPLEPPLDPGVDPGWSSIRVDERMAATWGGWTATGRGTVEAPGMPAIRMAMSDGREPGSTVSIPLASISTDLLPGWCLLHHGDVRLDDGAIGTEPNAMNEVG